MPPKKYDERIQCPNRYSKKTFRTKSKKIDRTQMCRAYGHPTQCKYWACEIYKRMHTSLVQAVLA